ncbi:MAG TPA: DUF4270 family protein [Sphingobacterium sp.]|nr:DUF4270 family protein [Sphingobacterium sp.]
MKQLIRVRYILFSFLTILLFTQSSCNKDFGISLGNPNEDLGVTIVDSLTIRTSTVQLEYVPTSGTGSLLVGKVNQPQIGLTTASSYFRVAFSNFSHDIPEGAVFDSVNLILTPDATKYYLGDTTQSQTVYVHRVNETIERTTLSPVQGTNNIPVYITGADIFSDQRFDYDATALGALTFNPRINTIESLNVRLEDNFGKSIFDLINDRSATVSTNDNFQQYLKGLVLVPDAANTVMVGLNDTIHLELNYSYIGGDGFNKTGKINLTTGSKEFQYNHIVYDRSGTDFAALDGSNRELASSATNGNIFLQAGTGVVAKLEFPSLRQFLNEPNMAVNKIELVIETTGSNYGAFPNPNSLMLLIANKHTGVPISFVRSPYAASIQTATLAAGNAFGKPSSYTFNMIDYIKTATDIANAETCLYLAVSSPNLFGRANTALIAKEDNQPKIKLNIVYTKFR